MFAEFTDKDPGSFKFSNLASLKDGDFDYQLIDNKDKISEICKLLITSKILSLDTETTGTDPITAELVGISFSVKKNQAFYIPVPSNYEDAKNIVQEFKEVFENEKSLKVGQNIKYDLFRL